MKRPMKFAHVLPHAISPIASFSQGWSEFVLEFEGSSSPDDDEMMPIPWSCTRQTPLSRQEKFNEVALQVGVESLKCLCVDNPSQWKSTYSMLKDALEYKEAFSRLKQEYDQDYKMCPSDLEWERLSVIIGCFKLFVEVTNFTRSKYLTASIYFPDICDIHMQLIEWCKNPDEYISSLAVKMRRKFDVYWEKCNLGLAVAAMLDPRFKMKLMEYYYRQLYGCSASEVIDDVLKCIKTLYNEHSIGSPFAASIDDQGLASWQLSDDRLMAFDKFLNVTSQDGQGIKTDLDKYLEETLFPRIIFDNFDVLNWWKIHAPSNTIYLAAQVCISVFNYNIKAWKQIL
ncbi:hypothetical protein Dsin_024154 [Dipteronia sinensis]|uniref:hAT-like transposase RNase-H fold domain-containing protein n=1 Tax=Dipteronia sinensis TaxID=43782 RepID=A0AAE0E1R5_9ROSI|nr:hypothetical protein Dsin_024154 [Dipteronia sinensis]